MRFIKNPYAGENAEENRDKIIFSLIERRVIPGIYVITFPLGEGNLLDICPSGMLFQQHFQREDITACGIAKGRDEAVRLAERIIMDCYNATGGFDVQSFLEDE